MANKNRIRFARSITRNNLPATLEYGEPGYVRNDRLIIGNDDGTEFTINDWNNLKNKPDLAGLETTVAFTTDETIQAYRVVRIKPSNGRVVRASRASLSTARAVGIVTAEAVNQSTALVQSSGVVGNPLWTWTPGDYIYLSNTVGDLTNDISGFSDTDARCLIGIAISATEILLDIEPPQLAHETAEFPIVQTVTDSDTTNVPSADAVHDHVASQIAAISLPPDLTTEVDNLEIRMDDAEADITTLSTDVSTLITDLDTAEINIGTNTTDISNLTNVVNGQIVQTVTDGDTTHAPSADAVHDYVQSELSNVSITPVQSVTDGDTTGVPSADAVYDFLFNNVVPYNGSTQAAGKFYSGTTDPVNSNRLNFDGNLHVNDLHTNASSIYIGDTRISTETGALIYKPDSQIEQDYEVVLTQLTGTLGPNPQTRIKGETFVDESILVLNQKQVGNTTPSRNARFEIERGTENNTAIRWNETDDRWEATNDGTTFFPIVLTDIDGKIPTSSLPSSVVNALKYRGMWSASGGTWPSSPDTGSYYIISANGTIDSTELQSGDWIVYNGTYWDKIDNTDRVTSVAGKVGNVTLTPADVGLQNVVNARAVQSPASSTNNRLVQWNDDTGDTVKTAPASISDTGELILHNHQAKVTVDRAGIGQNQSIAWNEGNQSFTSSAPFFAPNLPQIFQSNGLITGTMQQFLLVHEAQSVQFEITVSDRFSSVVRSETINTVLSNSDLKWSSTTHAKIGNSNAIRPTIAQDGVTTALGFEVTGGSWYVVVRATPMPFWNGVPVSYSMGIS